MKVIHFQRKPVSEKYFSIENSFAAIRKEMSSMGIEVNVAVCKYISQGFFPRLFNIIKATFLQGDVNHITGDVHYLNLFFDKKKTILTIHDCVFMQHHSSLARAVLKLFWLTLPAKKSAYITCVSASTKEELLNYIDFPKEKILIIPTVVDSSLFSFSPNEFNKKCPTFLFIGTTPNKNLELVAKALKGITCLMIIVGEVSKETKAILAENGIHYQNEVGINNQRMAEIYQKADALLFPSTYEGFGMPILEAQLTGRAVITSNYSSMPEVAGESACLVNPFDAKSIREGVLKVMEDDNYRNDLIEKGKENVKRFEARKVAEMYVNLYKQMV